MRLKLLPGMRHVSPLLPSKGVKEFFKTRCRSRNHSYMMVIYLCLFMAFLIRFFFVMSAVATIDDPSITSDCSSLGSLSTSFNYYYYYTDRVLGWDVAKISIHLFNFSV